MPCCTVLQLLGCTAVGGNLTLGYRLRCPTPFFYLVRHFFFHQSDFWEFSVENMTRASFLGLPKGVPIANYHFLFFRREHRTHVWDKHEIWFWPQLTDNFFLQF